METGTRNRLIHVNRQNKRSNSLEIINAGSEDIFELIYASRKTMRFLAMGNDKAGDDETSPVTAHGQTQDTSERYNKNKLETPLGTDGLQKRLLKIYGDAKTSEEEQGVNILFLAMGFLSWFEDETSDVKREAPLILLPVELVRNQRTSTFELKVRDDDVTANLPLQERLKGDFGIDLPDVEIDDDSWTPAGYFDDVAATVSSKRRWSIDRDGMQLGFFSFAKLLMFRDLDPKNWPDNALERHTLTTGLLYERFEAEENLFGSGSPLDECLSPEDIYHVVDADASQAKVIEEVRKGRNLVVQGPPGTGKSQTITNIIAAAVRDGKRVLFVAEKMAALSVVHKRLVDVGLSDLCLELHSKSANKKAVLADLARTLNAAQTIPEVPEPPHGLRAARDQLNAVSEALHGKVGLSGESAFEALAQQVHFTGLSKPTPSMSSEGLTDISIEAARRLGTQIVSFGDAIEKSGPLQDHPFFGVEQLDFQPTDLVRLSTKLAACEEIVATLNKAILDASAALQVQSQSTLATAKSLADQLSRIGDAPDDSDETLTSLIETSDRKRLRENLEIGLRWQSARREDDTTFVDLAWDRAVLPLRSAVAAGRTSFFARWGPAYRRASRELAGLLRQALPKSAVTRTALLDRLIEIARLRAILRDDEAWCTRSLGDAWRGERTRFQHLLDVLDWADQTCTASVSAPAKAIIGLARNPDLRREIESTVTTSLAQATSTIGESVRDLKLNVSSAFNSEALADANLGDIARKATAISRHVHRYEEWVNLQRLRANLLAANLQNAFPALEAGQMSGQAARTEFLYARAEAVWKAALGANPTLADLRNFDRHDVVRCFQTLEVERRRDCVDDIRAHHLRQVPQGAQGAMGFIRGEIGKKKSHAPIRKLISQAGEAVQRIKPVLMMSPISVAQFLPPASIEFDLLLIDEASQVRPEDALGAISRAKQIVVVGDQKQLPPSSFFDRMSDGEAQDGEDDLADLLEGVARVGDMESILTLCEARGVPTRMLEWHYRSRDPSLIQVSNREFYEDRLILPPSPLQGDANYGLKFNRVQGLYDRGGKRDNRIEAEALVKRVAEHARTSSDLSLGVVTFSFAQRNLITELLEFHRRKDPVLDSFLREGGLEDVFVKNIENVQGDERDIIFVSVGYGPSTQGGKPTMSFGPVNNEGGERRLNVLFTRARMRCEIFCSFEPGDMDLSKSRLEGPRVLKRFLDFAKTGVIEDRIATGAEPDSPLEADIAAEIRKLGFLADHQVGTAGFLIDLGVRHPDRPGAFILAVECDGATYHSALWARERDRLRQDVLEHLGWKFHRIWSTDWFYRRAAEIERLKSALEEARLASRDGIKIRGANSESEQDKTATTLPSPTEPIILIEARERTMPHYQRAQISFQTQKEPHEVAISVLAQLVSSVVETEGPVHEDEVSRRIAAAFGKEKAGSRIHRVTQQALRAAMESADSALIRDGEFWLTRTQGEDLPVRDRSNETGPTASPAYISSLELVRCLEIAVEDNAGGSDQDIIRAAARLFGFKRVGPELQARLESVQSELKPRAAIPLSGANFRPAGR